MKKIIILIFIMTTLISAKESNKEKYIFLGNDKMAPIIYLKNSIPAGIVVDLTKALAQKNGLNIDIKLMDWDKAQAKVSNEEADALLHINLTKESNKEYDFSENLFKSDYCIYRRYDRNDIQDIKSLFNLKVGAEIKGFPASILKRYPEITVKTLSSLKEGLELVQKGEIDAIISNRWGGEYLLATNDLSEITIVDEPIASLYSKIAVKKGNLELLEKINEGIKMISDDGTMEKILKRWSKEKIVYFTQKQYDYILLFIIISLLVLALFILIAFYSLKIKRINLSLEIKQEELESKSDQLQISKQQLVEVNNSLEKRIDKELKKNMKHQTMIMHQSKLAQMGEMIDNIAHQWRQPLAEINSAVLLIDEELIKRNLLDENTEEKLSEIENITEYMSGTIDDFKNFFDSNKKKKIFNIYDNVLKTLNIINKRISYYRIKVDLMIDDKSRIWGNANELNQVLLIIINNSIDAFIEKEIVNPLITISIKENENSIIIYIKDNALGIDKEIINKVFDPYFTTKHKSQGTGLGLYISKMIMEKSFNAEIVMNNEKNGTCTILKIPKEYTK